MGFLVFLLASLLASTAPARAQEEPRQQEEPPEDQGFRIGVRVDQVFLSVTARSVNGGFVDDLKPDDLRIYEDGVEQDIVNFAREAVPAHVALLIDASGSTRHSQSSIQRAAYNFASQLDGEDRVAVITFSSKIKLIQDWTNDLELLDNRLKSIWAKGVTLLHDAIYLTYDDLFKDVTGKRAVILLTDGVDVDSYYSREEVLRLAESSEATVYVVSLLEEYRMHALGARAQLQARMRPIPRVYTDEYIRRSQAFLKRLAYNTGGRLFSAASATYLGEIYEEVAEEIKNQYYISYIPTNKRKDGRWRTIEIESQRPDTILKTRPGYYAEGAPASPGK